MSTPANMITKELIEMAAPRNHEDFLNAVFHAAQNGETGCIATVLVSNDKRFFPASPWPLYKTQDFHTHWGVGLHLPRDPAIKDRNKFRRTKETWCGMHSVVFDDIGEDKPGMTIKVPELEPSFIIETKPGSSQWGYILAEPVRDYDHAHLIQTAAVAAGINDAGGQNPARLVRLPGSKPPGKTHAARLAHWTGRHFNAEDLVAQLGLDLYAAKKIKRSTHAKSLSSGDPVPVPVGDDPVLQWLSEMNLILADGSAEGWVDIICPWHVNHTDGDTGGTGYRPPTDADPYRSFHCFHRCGEASHDQGGKDTEAFLKWVRTSGGPDVGTLDEAARQARVKVNQNLRKGTLPGMSDPVLMEHVKAAKVALQAGSSEDHKRRLNSIAWLLADDAWGDAEIIRACISARVTGPDILATVNFLINQIDSIRARQAANGSSASGNVRG